MNPIADLDFYVYPPQNMNTMFAFSYTAILPMFIYNQPYHNKLTEKKNKPVSFFFEIK